VSEESKLSQLPSVHEVLERLEDLTGRFPHEIMVVEVRRAIARARGEMLSGNPETVPVVALARTAIEKLAKPSLRRVINATGVVLHTNLGRAPLGAVAGNGGYSNLEYDLTRGRRGKRDVHIAGLLDRLLGKTGVAVNNNAAAVYLVLNALASGGEVIVSRGELIEIGEGFRIPEIMEQSGAVLREVGTTNKTHLADYERAINENTRLIMSVHHSNFRISGFTSKPTLRELVGLGKDHKIPVYEDLGSGCMIDLKEQGIDEHRPAESLEAGVGVVSFSGDKLLGGPQAGLIVGGSELIHRVRKHPMFRALRLDKLIYEVLEASLRNLLLERYDEIPALRMIRMPAADVKRRAEALAEKLPALESSVEPGVSVIGGGSTPEQEIPTWLLKLQVDGLIHFEERLRNGDPPVIARIENDRLVLDLRTVFPDDEPELIEALTQPA
jgi:L-seryl-tRNA(Ser) seleniumtransferase